MGKGREGVGICHDQMNSAKWTFVQHSGYRLDRRKRRRRKRFTESVYKTKHSKTNCKKIRKIFKKPQKSIKDQKTL